MSDHTAEEQWLLDVQTTMDSMNTALRALWVAAPFTQLPTMAQMYHLVSDLGSQCYRVRRKAVEATNALSDRKSPRIEWTSADWFGERPDLREEHNAEIHP